MTVSAVLTNGETVTTTNLPTGGGFSLGGLDHLGYRVVVSGTGINTVTLGPVTLGVASTLDVGTINLVGVDCKAPLGSPGAHLAGANLAGKSLEGCNLAGDDLTGRTSPAPAWPAADLHGATLDNATMSGAQVAGTNLAGATFSGVTSGAVTGTPGTADTGRPGLGGLRARPTREARRCLPGGERGVPGERRRSRRCRPHQRDHRLPGDDLPLELHVHDGPPRRCPPRRCAPRRLPARRRRPHRHRPLRSRRPQRHAHQLAPHPHEVLGCQPERRPACQNSLGTQPDFTNANLSAANLGSIRPPRAHLHRART